MIVTLQAGDGSGRTAVVNDDGRLVTEVQSPVTTKRRAVTVEATTAIVGTTSDEALPATPDRCSLWIQNKDGSNSVFIRFGEDDATEGDWEIPARGELRADGLRCESAVQAIASGADTPVLFLEMVEEA